MKKKIIVGIVFVLIVIAALILAGLYILTDTFKSDKELFFEYLSNTNFMENANINKYINIYKNESASNYSEVGNMSFETASNADNTNVADIQQLLNLKYNVLRNKNLQQDYADVTLNTNNEDLITVRYLRDGNTYGIKIENVLKKYLALENKDLKELYSKLGITDSKILPNVIATASIQDLLDIDENQLNILKSKYGNIILNNLSKKNFKKTKNNDNTTTISLSLTEREFANIIIQELIAIENDGNTLNFIINKAKMLGYSLNADEIINYIQKQIDAIKSNNNINDEHFLTIAITDKGKETAKIDVTLQYENNEKSEELNNTKEELYLSIDCTQENKMVILVKDVDSSFMLDISYGYEENKMWENIDIFSLDSQTNTKKDIGKIKHQISLNEKNIVQTATISVNSEENQKIQISINDSKSLKQDIQIEKITNQNAEILNNKTKEELENLKEAIIKRIYYVYGDRINNFLNSIDKSEKQYESYKDLEILNYHMLE